LETQNYTRPVFDATNPSINIVNNTRQYSNRRPVSISARKRILLITADGDPGGGVTNVLQLCRALRKTGDWHISLCTQADSYLVAQAATICDEVHTIDFFKSRFDPRVPWQLRTLIRKLSPDLIHTHGSRAALPTVYAIKHSTTPLIHTVHGFHFYQKSWLPRFLAIEAERRIALHAQKVIFVCKHDKKIADQENIVTNNQTSIIVHHGIHIEDLPTKKPSAKPTVVMLGRLVYQKHPEILIEVADRLRSKGIAFQFIGGGPLQAELEKEVKRRNLQDIVTFSGAVPRDEALQLAAKAVVAILPSRWEGFPISLLELLGMGIPVVAASVHGVPEVITHSFNGFLVGLQNPQIYAHHVQLLIDNSVLRSYLARNAHETIASDFNETRMAQSHIDLYQKLVTVPDRLQATSIIPAHKITEHAQTASVSA
jgi:glycosyltransferase involved in cell wall biosynthesis